MKPRLNISDLIREAGAFCEGEWKYEIPELFGITDGKAVGTFVEHRFKDVLSEKYDVIVGSSASGIDLPTPDINTDIKVTSIKQPQSSCPFKNARQKIYGLGYNLLLFVYEKMDDPRKRTCRLNFFYSAFIEKHRTADYQITRTIRQMIENDANEDDIIAYLTDRNLPADEITMSKIASEILQHPPEQGYLTISNALQWRLQYGRIVSLDQQVDGIVQIRQAVQKR